MEQREQIRKNMEDRISEKRYDQEPKLPPVNIPGMKTGSQLLEEQKLEESDEVRLELGRASTREVESARGQDKDNLSLWKSVWRTDPSYVKRVNQRGGFHAIDAQYKILKATRTFGPIGIGWGWDIKRIWEVGETMWIEISLWYNWDGETAQFPTLSSIALKSSKGVADADAAKKLETDAVTKALSRIGFCADVFLGKFDDHKYVQSLRSQNGKK